MLEITNFSLGTILETFSNGLIFLLARYLAGKLRGNQVSWRKQRLDGKEIVDYVGGIGNSTIKGTCSQVIGDGAGMDVGCGTFLFKRGVDPSLNRLTPEVVPVGEPHLWTGYYMQEDCETKMSTHLLFTDTFKIYGFGRDAIGRFTWLGTYVNPFINELAAGFMLLLMSLLCTAIYLD